MNRATKRQPEIEDLRLRFGRAREAWGRERAKHVEERKAWSDERSALRKQLDAYERASKRLFDRSGLTSEDPQWLREVEVILDHRERDLSEAAYALEAMVEAFAQFRLPHGVAQIRALAKAEALLR